MKSKKRGRGNDGAEAGKASKRKRSPPSDDARRRGASDGAKATLEASKREAKSARKAAKAAGKAAAEAAERRARLQGKALRLAAKAKAAADPAKRLALQAKLSALLSKLGPDAPAEAAAGAMAAKQQQGWAGQQQLSAHVPTKIFQAAVSGQGQAPQQQQQQQRPAVVFSQNATSSGALAGIATLRLTPQEQERRTLRQRRFAADLAQQKQQQRSSSGGGAPASGEEESEGHLRLGCLGMCCNLEKDYLRLTRLPLASEVRPPDVLRHSLAMVKRKWRDGVCSYHYAWQQLKSIRQDLTVQGVADELSVDVYQTHGRVALESGDTSEFRQCLSVLRRLYARGLPGDAAEFAAYGVLFAAGHGHRMLTHELAIMDGSLLDDPAVQHALQVVRAARSGSYLRYIQLYATAPRMAPYLMDCLLERVRARALRTVTAAYSPLPLPLEWLAEQLGFESAEECATWAVARGAVVDARRGELLTRESRAAAAGPPAPASSR